MVENEVILEDSLFNIFSDPEPIYFRSIEGINQVSKSGVYDKRGSIMVRVELDGKVHQHRRSVLTFLEVTGININSNKIGTLGGIFEILELGVGALIGLYASNSFRIKLCQEIMYWQKELKELKKILNKVKKTNDNCSNNEDARNEEEKVQIINISNQYEGGENTNFARVKPYEYQEEANETK